MSTTIDLAETLAQGYRDLIHTYAYEDGEVVNLPQHLSDGRLVSLFVHQVGDDLFEISDRGLAADSLCDWSVDLSTSRADRSWRALLDSIELPPAVREDHPYAITGQAARGELSLSIQTLASAVLRADGMRVLGGSFRAQTFAHQVLQRVFALDLPVVSNARIRGRHGGQRTVTCRVGVEDQRPVYVQALSGSDAQARTRNYDHAYALFGGSEVGRDRSVVVMQDLTRWDRWQCESLTEVAIVKDQDEIESIRLLAA